MQRQSNNYNPQINQAGMKQYNEELCKLAGFSFPYNNLLLVSLIKRIPHDVQDQKELHLGFITCVLGVGNNNNRTYDFNQKIVQKFSLKDLQSLAFTLKQLAIDNTNVLPFTKFTNSGNGPKTLYLQYKQQIDNYNNINNSNAQQQFQTQQSNEIRQVNATIILGSSHNGLKINIALSKSDAYSIGSIIETLYNTGIQYEINSQVKSNSDKMIGINNSVSQPQYSPVNNNGVQFPTTTPVNVGQSVIGNNSVPPRAPISQQPNNMADYGNNYM